MQITSHKPILEISHLSFSYGENEVLKDINLSIEEGEYVAMIGPNGAGKTTLLKIILGLLKSTKGSVELFGTPIEHFKEWSKIGYVPQKALNFDSNFPATVEEVVRMGRFGKRGLFHSMTKEDTKEVQKALEQVGMWELRDRQIGALSGGQQQRAFIARALAGEPKIIFLDEPTVGVDKKTTTEFYSLLKKLNGELRLTLILISHDIETVTKEAKRIACVNKEVICFDTPEAFLKHNHTCSSATCRPDIKIIKTHSHS